MSRSEKLKEEGLLKNYLVQKISNPKKNMDCIVLEFDDPIARVGIAAWCNEMQARGYLKVAADVGLKLWAYDRMNPKEENHEKEKES